MTHLTNQEIEFYYYRATCVGLKMSFAEQFISIWDHQVANFPDYLLGCYLGSSVRILSTFKQSYLILG